MAVIKNILVAAALLSSLTTSAPLNARGLVINIVTETDWTTVDVTATVWLNNAQTTPGAQAHDTFVPAVATTTSVTEAQITSSFMSTSTSPSTSVVAGTFAQESSVAPTTSAAPLATTMATSILTTSAAPVTPVTSAAATSTSAAMAGTAKDVSASTSGTCEGESNACQGDVTHWDGGLGACGWNVDTASDFEIALPFEFMGTESNDNPYCGRSLTIYNPTSGVSVQATVGDKCMGCVDRAIDLTDVLFTAIVPDGDGRVSGIDWWFN